MGIGTGTGTVLGKAADMANLSATKSTLDGIKAIWVEYGAEVTFVACTGIVCFTLYMISLQKDDIQEGRATPSGAEQ